MRDPGDEFSKRLNIVQSLYFSRLISKQVLLVVFETRFYSKRIKKTSFTSVTAAIANP